jgi:hypothetical protein
LHAAEVDGVLHLPPGADHDAAGALSAHAVIDGVALKLPR